MPHPLQIISVITVIKCEGRFLLVQRHEDDDIFPGKWQNLGGKVELGETIEEAVKREILEEVGLELDHHPEFLLSYSWKKDDDSPVRLGAIFTLNLDGSMADYEVKINEELADHGWFEFDEVEQMEGKEMLIGTGNATGTFGQIRKTV